MTLTKSVRTLHDNKNASGLDVCMNLCKAILSSNPVSMSRLTEFFLGKFNCPKVNKIYGGAISHDAMTPVQV